MAVCSELVGIAPVLEESVISRRGRRTAAACSFLEFKDFVTGWAVGAWRA